MDGDGAKEIRESCISIFVHFYVREDNKECYRILDDIIKKPGEFINEARRLIAEVEKLLTYGPVLSSHSEKDIIRKRAFDVVENLLQSVYKDYKTFEDKKELSDNEQKVIRNLVEIADFIGMRIYFSSGAFDSKQERKESQNRRLTDEEKERFLKEAALIFDLLGRFKIPHLIYHMIETLEYFINLNPAEILLRVRQILFTGKQSGYQYETMAADHIVHIVERYLAEYRHILKENRDCQRVLIEILDIFVEAGWVNAIKLVYRMEEIFR